MKTKYDINYQFSDQYTWDLINPRISKRYREFEDSLSEAELDAFKAPEEMWRFVIGKYMEGYAPSAVAPHLERLVLRSIRLRNWPSILLRAYGYWVAVVMGITTIIAMNFSITFTG